MKRIFYFHPLVFHFNSGMTLQVVRDFTHLSSLGYEAYLYGTYTDEESFAAVKRYIGDAPVRLTVLKGTEKRMRHLVKALFLWRMFLLCRRGSFVIARHYNQAMGLLRTRQLFRRPLLLLELHETAFPHLIEYKRGMGVPELKRLSQEVIGRADGLILTNFSQEVMLKREFTGLPPYEVFPNGVERERFTAVLPNIPTDGPGLDAGGRAVVTYAGQFAKWKNVELLFASVALLDSRFSLRIAGGKGDEKSIRLVERLTERYKLQGRVDYRGFVPPEKLAGEVLDGSSVLALPLGDNVQAKYFTSPMKLFEYMATGVPVVAVDYPSVSMVTGGDSVFLSENDPAAFAKAITTAVTAPDRAERVARMNSLSGRYTYEERSRRLHAWLTGLAGRIIV